MPAQAGIQNLHAHSDSLDSRIRGHDDSQNR
jgi:hypothetical protein